MCVMCDEALKFEILYLKIQTQKVVHSNIRNERKLFTHSAINKLTFYTHNLVYMFNKCSVCQTDCFFLKIAVRKCLNQWHFMRIISF